MKLEVKTDPSIMGGMIGEKYVCKNQHSEVEQSNADFQSVDFLSVEFFFSILNLGETIKCFLNIKKNLFRPPRDLILLLSDTVYKIPMEPLKIVLEKNSRKQETD